MTQPNALAAAWDRGVRACRAAGLLAFVGAAAVWLAPLSVPGKNFQPFGCGSPASPMDGQLAAHVCGGALSTHRGVALALLAAAIALLGVSELLLPRVVGRTVLLWVAVVSIVALPLIAVSIVGLFAPLTAYGADGSQFRCGSALEPVQEPFARGLCGQLPESRKALSVSTGPGALLLLAGATYVGAAGSAASERGRHESSANSPRVDADGAADGV